MPANDRKVAEIIMEEVRALDERCEGYRTELTATISDILAFERLHRVRQINIQQQVSEKCKATGEYLARNRKS